MYRKIPVCLLPIVSAALCAAQTAPSDSASPAPVKTPQQPAFLTQLKVPPLHDFRPQQPKRIELANGMIIFLEEDHELPLIDGTMMIRGGSRLEPAEKAGLVQLYGEAWRTGGTASQTGDQLDTELEARAAHIETGGGLETTDISVSCLKDDWNFVFDRMVALLEHPEFREEKLALAKRQLDSGISRRNDEAGQIAGRESLKLVYGASNPYAREPEYATVAAVSREDLVNWHKAHVLPNNIIFGIVGDFDSAAMEAQLRKTFEALPRGPKLQEPEISFQDLKPGIYEIQKSNVNQSQIRMVALGIRRDNPDFYAVEVMNEVFGGGFGSRLFNTVRTEKGLAYQVGGSFGAAYDHPGIFRITTSTKSRTTAAAIDALYEEVDKLKKVAPSPDEMKRAKDQVLNSFVFNYDSKEKILRERMNLEFYGYPADYLDRYKAAIEKVTSADVARVANKYVDKSKLAVLVVGKDSDFDRKLSDFGTVTMVDVTIPGSPAGNAIGRRAAEK